MIEEPAPASDAEDDAEDNTGFSAEFQRLRREEKGLAPEADRKTDLPEATEEEERLERQDREDRDEPAPGAKAAETPAEEEADIWEGADPKLKAAFDAKAAEAAEERRVRLNQDGRLSATARELNQLRTQQAPKRDAAAAPAKGEEADDDEERMQQLREEFPEVATPILDRMLKLENRLKAVESQGQTVQAERNQAFYDRQEELLAEAHSDWQDVVSKQAFVDWAKKKPAHLRRAIIENAAQIVDAESVADVLTRYKAETTTPETPEAKALREKRERRRDGGRLPRSKTPAGGKEGDGGSDSFSAEWASLRDKERREAAAGR